MRRRYQSDLTDAQWQHIEPHVLLDADFGRPRTTDLREVVNALLYMSRAGCQWHMLPSEFPPKSTVHDYFRKWGDSGILDEISRVLREKVRVRAGRNKNPSAAIIDSQTTKTTSISEGKGYDGAKKIKGTKRHIAVDVMGLILSVIVHSAGVQDRKGAKWLTAALLARFPGIKRIWADGGYTGKPLIEWVKALAQCVFEVVKRPRKKFKIVKWRWIVERTFGWFNSYRRLSKDYEYYHKSSEAWIKLVSINIMVHRLSPG